ncbi:PDZK1-interacting protein 1 isoform X1 [Arvicanthis niloticus]|uniref:PDZK1-interacting protein 1 isoform X1 n=2 Tax=Arvicanthis niloticus TaxID=61156 RepID=UPI0014864538|nr:PDZK1-interacting protein 1 isoform X1 [Arvicanthis niloticus]
MPVCWAGHQPGLAAHFQGRKGSLSSPVCQSFLPPSLHFCLTQSCLSFRASLLSSCSHTNTPDLQQLQESKHQQWTKALQLPAAMLALSLLVLGLLTQVAPASCQQGLGNLQPWMQGLIAVAVFLVLVAIVFAVNHFWCQEEPEPGSTVMIIGNKADGVLVGMDGRYSSMASGFRSSEHKNAFENVLEEEGRVRSTPM